MKLLLFLSFMSFLFIFNTVHADTDASIVSIKVGAMTFAPSPSDRLVTQKVKLYSFNGSPTWKNISESEETEKTANLEYCYLQLDYYVDLKGSSRHEDEDGVTTYDPASMTAQTLALTEQAIDYGTPEDSAMARLTLEYLVNAPNTLGLKLTTQGVGSVYLSRISCSEPVTVPEAKLKPEEEFKKMISRYFPVQ